ncbi:MAG: polyphosphate kinase 1, partial [Kiritimatiellae bacterium]|nr:polyphosphate kinase 1 [Kiritimatiellia bacterium]
MARHLKPHHYINRELSWLEFNRRVLEEARDPGVPLLERMKFLAITASNLDEFFMVRIGGLEMLCDQRVNRADESGRTPRALLSELGREVRAFAEAQYETLAELDAALAETGIRRVRMNRLTGDHLAHLSNLFDREVFPLLTPRAVEPDAEFPAISSLSLHLAVRVRAGEHAPERRAVVEIPRSLPRFFTLPGEEGYSYLLAEDLIALHLERLFPGHEVIEYAAFRVTRNADMSVVEDLASDLMSRMQAVLVARRHSDVVRLEMETSATSTMRGWLQSKLEISDRHLYRTPGPPMLSSWMSLSDAPGFERLRYERWPPQPSPQVRPQESMFENIARGDVLLYHPYDSYDPVVRFIQEAAADPDVLAIKQVLYRCGRKSPIVAALARAAMAGKLVTVIVELKARFDEARNIDWARALEEAGVQVIYGIRGLKTHAKICLVIRREPDGLKRYVHFGTGNYNEQTARVYADLSLMSAHPDYGADASQFFNTITGIAQPAPYRLIDAAPLGLRPRLLELIESEAERARQGQTARIVAKMNSCSDPEIIAALYDASRAGVRVDLLVRGICGLRPGVQKLSERIRVFSVVDRFLEHARVFSFLQGGSRRIFIASADWMLRNLDKRIELMVEVVDDACRSRLADILETHLRDNVKARQLQPDG